MCACACVCVCVFVSVCVRLGCCLSCCTSFLSSQVEHWRLPVRVQLCTSWVPVTKTWIQPAVQPRVRYHQWRRPRNRPRAVKRAADDTDTVMGGGEQHRATTVTHAQRHLRRGALPCRRASRQLRVLLRSCGYRHWRRCGERYTQLLGSCSSGSSKSLSSRQLIPDRVHL